MKFKSLTLIFPGLLLALLLASCQPEKPLPPPVPKQQVTVGQCTLALYLEPEAPKAVSETIRITLQADIPEGWSFTGMDVTAQRFPNFQLTHHPDPPQLLTADGKRRITRCFTLEPWIAKEYPIPTITATIIDPQGKETRLTLPEFSLQLEPLPPLEEALPTLTVTQPEPIRSLPWSTQQKLLALLGAIGGVALILGVWLFIRRYYRLRLARQNAPIPPDKAAMHALEALEKRQLPQQGAYQEFCFELSGILRRYLEESFQIRAPRLTTPEFLEQLRHSPRLYQEHHQLLTKFLRTCDMVKFAQVIPADSEAQKLLHTCREFVLCTTQPPAESSAPSHSPER